MASTRSWTFMGPDGTRRWSKMERRPCATAGPFAGQIRSSSGQALSTARGLAVPATVGPPDGLLRRRLPPGLVLGRDLRRAGALRRLAQRAHEQLQRDHADR